MSGALQRFEPGLDPSPESGPGSVLGPFQDSSWDQTWVPGTVPDRSQDRFWLTTNNPKRAQDRSQDRSQDWSQDRSCDRSRDRSRDRSWEFTFRAFGRAPATIIDSNHFQLHPTPVPSAGGWDGRQRVGGFKYSNTRSEVTFWEWGNTIGLPATLEEFACPFAYLEQSL